MKKSLLRRVFFAGLFHETHTFLSGQTTLDDCACLEGESLLAIEDKTSPLGGLLAAARELGWEMVPSVDVRAMPGPIVADAVVQWWWERVERDIRTALMQGLDGVFLVLHGAMVSESFLDVEGEILERIRALVGEDIPIGGVTDLHANFSQRMAQNSNILLTYRENPHTDSAQTAHRAALLLDFLMSSDELATTFFESAPIFWAPTATATAQEPMLALEQLARQIEANDAEVLAVNVHAGFSFADVPESGVSFSIVSVASPHKAQNALKELLALSWETRERGIISEASFENIAPLVRNLLLQNQTGPIVLTEPSDNIGGGAPGSGTGLLRGLIQYSIGRSVIVLCAPRAVDKLIPLAIGARLRLEMGGENLDFPESGAIALEIELLGHSDGRFRLEDSHSHLASMWGENIEMGRCATVRHILPDGTSILILLTSLKTPPFDLGQLRSQGIVPEKMGVIGVKAAVAHRRAYDPIASHSFAVETAGPCSSDLLSFSYKHVRRPIFPLDQLLDRQNTQ